MYSHNYKNLPYKQSVKKFLKDYRILYNLFGRFTYWRTKDGQDIKVKNLTKNHIRNIVARFGNTYIRTKHPYIWYRYLKEVEKF